MDKIRSFFDSFASPMLLSLFLILFLAESWRQLRRRTQERWKRVLINVIVSIPAFTLLRLLLIPAMVWLAVKNQTWHFGLSYLVALPVWAETAIMFILLDYFNYLWHILNHKIPLLWRFHLVHHTDADLDVTTALRFHFGEIFGSVIYRGAVVFLIGASPGLVLVYELLYEAATAFHHSNMRLPSGFEKLLNKLIVTPRMHGIHHSVRREQTDSNYSVIFSFWDRIHKTARLKVPQPEVVIGVPAYSDKKELTIGFLLKLPFTKIRRWEDA